MGSFDLVIQSSASLHEFGEPDEYISEYAAIIRYQRERDSKIFRVGKLHAYRLHVDLATNAGVSFFDVCDSHSQMMSDLYGTLCDPVEDDLKESVRQQFEGFDSDILVLDYCVLHPRWRGLKLGLVAVRKFVDLLGGGCGLTVCEMAPLHPDIHDYLGVPAAWLPRHEAARARKEATLKLRRYYRLMGFERIERTPYYGLSMAHVLPSVEDLLRPSR